MTGKQAGNGANGSRHEFAVAPGIVRHLIESQAGSIDKALLETVMNGVDAKASEIRVDFMDDKTIVVEDNGCGFASREEILEHFGTFGFDHRTVQEQSRGRTYGRFGLGRGQIMAFGATVWRSNGFRMEVDVRNEGLEYVVVDDPETAFGGCRIEVSLYERLPRTMRTVVKDELRQMVKYVPCAVVVDGTRVNVDPEKVGWTERTERLLFREKADGTSGLEVYNQGSFVKQVRHDHMGISGVLCSREGYAFELNTARNDILLSKCRLWKEAKQLLEKYVRNRQEKHTLNDDDRVAILRELRYAEEAERGHYGMKLFKTVEGRALTAGTVSRHAKGAVTVAARNSDHVGEHIHRSKQAAVLSPQMLEWTGHTSAKALVEWMRKVFNKQQFVEKDYDAMAEDVSERLDVLCEAQWTKTEKVAMKPLQMMADRVAHDMGVKTREVMIGQADASQAWTDGEHWIAVDREHLGQQLKRQVDGWTALHHLLVHEYAHDETSEGDHVHGPEFYVRVHDYFLKTTVRHTVTVLDAFERYCKARAKRGLKETYREASRRDQVDRVKAMAREAGQERGQVELQIG